MKTNQAKIKKNTIIKSLIVFIICVLTGGTLGFFIGNTSEKLESFDFSALKEFANSVLIYALPAIFLIVTAFVAIFTLATYSKAKKIYKAWDGEDEVIIENTERLIDIAVSVLTVGFVAVLMLFGIYTYAIQIMSKEVFMAMFSVTLGFHIIFIGYMIFSITMQRACVQFVKKINPEKRGEVLAINFAKEWEQSLDEAQKLMTFEAGYRTFKLTNYAFTIAWVISLMGIYFGLGLAPVIFVSLLWLAMTISYVAYGYKIEHKSKNKKR